ncbi:response regulator transcription factor [Ilumatobacter coccineus]|jgi:two-component system, OmpR family, response regulator MprA|uniref:Two-component response regulator MprA n=1 Tax=Ilumatobacter coccineus (strain NBRC 103263 / KCTC 29153 / YM16-304) TaxID=1313172 RepID=A0A6C7E568_ILUCY|nr:response regulator transcription factor [Ilumatobacter coccineus]BAN00405.1 two-component response regulator MprA [Ilumatobacter coccineus YM16-304]
MPSDEKSSRCVLVVDDDNGIRETLRMALSYEGYEVRVASNGAEGLHEMNGAGAGNIDMAIVDVMMPEVDGLEMCRSLRRRLDPTPILVLTARSSVKDRVAGLDAGADDYLVKPFDLGELLARVRALLRRGVPLVGPTRIEAGDLSLDLMTRAAQRGDRQIELTKTEFSLLHALMSNLGVVRTREELYEEIWGFDLSASSRSLDVYVSYLRQKTEANGESRLIETVRGTGFIIRNPG